MKSVRPLYLVAFLLMIVLVLPVCPVYANAQTPSNNRRSGATVGMFKVWVPAGIIGDEYWIYLDGHMVSAPPHAATDPTTMMEDRETLTRTPDGWRIVGGDDLILTIVHENWTPNVTTYMDSAGDPLHLFKGFIFPLSPGKHTIELAIFIPGEEEFPFVITGKRVRDIHRGETTRVFVGVPDHWIASSPYAAPLLVGHSNGNTVCSFDKPAPPDVDGLEKLYNRFDADPNVIALRGVDASSLSRPKGVAVLDLPVEQGGSREFDGRQIREIAYGIARNYPLPPLSDVAECQQHFPRFSSYGVYGKVISAMDREIKSFHNLAAKLEGGH